MTQKSQRAHIDSHLPTKVLSRWKVMVTDGPFVETKEHAFALSRSKNIDDAIPFLMSKPQAEAQSPAERSSP
jgi:hypothetical protein